MSAWMWAYVIGCGVWGFVALVTDMVGVMDDDDSTSPEWAKIALLVILCVTWPWQLCVFLYCFGKKLLR